MKPENQALVNVVLAVAIVTGFAGAYFLLSPSAPPSTLPILEGTDFTRTEAVNWTAHLTVGPSGGTLVGAWTAYNGTGYITLDVVNGTGSKPPNRYLCPLVLFAWREQNGTVDLALPPGPYTIFWTAGFCSSAASIVVTQTIQIEPA